MINYVAVAFQLSGFDYNVVGYRYNNNLKTASLKPVNGRIALVYEMCENVICMQGQKPIHTIVAPTDLLKQ